MDIYKGLEDIERDSKLADEEKAELKLYQKLACKPQSHRRNACGGGESEATAERSLTRVTMPRRYSGLNFPVTVYTAINEMIASADAGFENIWSLQDCIETLYEFGDEDIDGIGRSPLSWVGLYFMGCPVHSVPAQPHKTEPTVSTPTCLP